MYVLRYAEEHNLVLEEPSYPMAYEKVNMGNGYTLESLAKHTGLCIEDLEYLNPSLKKVQYLNLEKQSVSMSPNPGMHLLLPII